MRGFYFAQKAFIVNDNRILLVKKSAKDPYHPNKWEVPGGRMHFGEGITEHLKREVMEEVGLDIIIGDPFAMWTWIMEQLQEDGETNHYQVVAVAVHCIALNDKICSEYRVESDYLSDTEWVPIEDIFSYDLIPDIIPAMKAFKDRFCNNP